MVEIKVKDIMNKSVKKISPYDTLDDARELMVHHGIHHLVVVDGSKITGMISNRDIPKVKKPIQLKSMFVADVMKSPVVTAQSNISISQAAQILRGHYVGSLPIVNKGKLVGIVTLSDLLVFVQQCVQNNKSKVK